MFRNYLGFAGQAFCLKCRLLEFWNFYGLVQVLGFWILCNGMVEFLVILVNGQIMGFGKLYLNQCMVAYVPLRQKDQVIMQFMDDGGFLLFALTFAQVTLSGFQPSMFSHTFFIFYFLFYFYFKLSFCVDCPFGFSTYLFFVFFMLP